MRSYNKVTLIGFVQDITLGEDELNFGIMVENSGKIDALQRIDCIAYGKLGEIIYNNLKLTANIFVEGSLQNATVVVKDVRFL